MSGGWGTPYAGRHRSTDDPPEGALCIEDGCGFPAFRTRPAVEAWLWEGGVIGVDEAVEWVCAVHAD